jgi:hypothetical protein
MDGSCHNLCQISLPTFKVTTVDKQINKKLGRKKEIPQSQSSTGKGVTQGLKFPLVLSD